MVADLISTFLPSAGKLYHNGCYGNIVTYIATYCDLSLALSMFNICVVRL